MSSIRYLISFEEGLNSLWLRLDNGAYHLVRYERKNGKIGVRHSEGCANTGSAGPNVCKIMVKRVFPGKVLHIFKDGPDLPDSVRQDAAYVIIHRAMSADGPLCAPYSLLHELIRQSEIS